MQVDARSARFRMNTVLPFLNSSPNSEIGLRAHVTLCVMFTWKPKHPIFLCRLWEETHNVPMTVRCVLRKRSAVSPIGSRVALSNACWVTGKHCQMDVAMSVVVCFEEVERLTYRSKASTLQQNQLMKAQGVDSITWWRKQLYASVMDHSFASIMGTNRKCS